MGTMRQLATLTQSKDAAPEELLARGLGQTERARALVRLAGVALEVCARPAGWVRGA